jgi:hypothetical protein
MRLETRPTFAYLTAGESLESGAASQLRVHIGARMSESLMEGEIAGIDSLVGPPDTETGGHLIYISIQPKDFRILSPASIRLLLPRTGSSELAYFRIRAPRRSGRASLRITIHHRNHLVQSFLLQAAVGESESARGQIGVRQEFARSEQFTNLDELRERQLFLGFNQGQSTHQLMIKSDQATSEVNLGARAYVQAVQDLREALRDDVLDPNGFARRYPPVTPGNPPSLEAADAFRKLARLGRAVYDALFGALRDKGTRKALVRLQGSAKDKIQVVRFETHSTFPWSLL